ncbi:MAG: hypothetical protein JXB25_04245 [Deltaproteobacteria bacterium]|nr:hypothetical protein [Deltaproteobacteria bacterium]
MEKVGYILLGLFAGCWLVGMLAGFIAAFPFGLFGLLALGGIGLLFAKVVKERLASKEDDHYSRTVDK